MPTNHHQRSLSSGHVHRERTDDLELRPLLGVQDVSALLGVPKATLYRWHSLTTAEVPQGPRAFRVGKHLRYTLEDVRDYIERLRRNSA
jgi:predicted DNA-binding transcriptional regulator AlpA